MPDPVATTDRGQVGGLATDHGFAFLGIPYAKAPFGPLRFREPAVTEKWEGVRPATAPAPTAPQPDTGFTLIPEPIIDGGDAPECLSLNVFTPDLGLAGLPVLVWIHGGGFTNGTPSSTWYDGDRFARDGVVVVSVGYRLGAEGFLDIPGAPTNRAVRDWIAALEWVQRNVAEFGGDPAKVTVGGQSAGGAATMLLTTLPRAEGLLRAAVPMSGSVFPVPSPEQSGTLRDRVAEHLGIAATLEAFEGIGPAALVEAQIAATTAPDTPAAERVGRGLSFFPALDGDLVPVPPMKAIAAGAGGGVPLLIGTTREEMTAMARSGPKDDEAAARALARFGLDDEGAASYRADAASPAEAVGQALTDRTFRRPAVRVAEARIGGPAPTFHYEFQWRTPALGGLGSVHCLDLPFVFDVLDDDHVKVVAGDAPPQELADTMHRAWVSFVTDLDPGWAAYDAAARPTMAFDETSKVVDDLLEPVRSRWP
ncbi:MAG: carboxylesterase/lipase family protein [Acidimicrobiales bacterium]